MSDVRSVVEGVEKAVDGEDGSGVTGDDGGRREGCRAHSGTLKVDARTSVSKRRRAGDDGDKSGDISPAPRRAPASISHAFLRSETVARPRESASVEQRSVLIDADDAENAPDDDEKRIDRPYRQRE